MPLEKLILLLVLTSQKLMHNFQAHPIAIEKEFPLKNIFSKTDMSDRLSQDIKFLLRAIIKGQILANFVAEF